MKGRSITVNGQEFVYRVGRMMTIIRRKDDDSVFAKIESHVVRGVTPDTFERGQWKRTSDGAVTPADIANAIKRELAR